VDRAIAPGLALLAACFSPEPPSGAGCTVEEQCPAPLSCIDGVCQLPGPPPPDAPIQCPSGFTAMPSGSCHAEGGALSTWLGAELDCELRGGHLVIPDSPAEAMEIRNPRWIGVTDRVEEGTYRTVTGAIVSFTFWGAAEPNGGLSNCVHTGLQGRWQDGPCEFPFSFVCEHDGLPAAPDAY
jgi:hypothetical protein